MDKQSTFKFVAVIELLRKLLLVHNNLNDKIQFNYGRAVDSLFCSRSIRWAWLSML